MFTQHEIFVPLRRNLGFQNAVHQSEIFALQCLNCVLTLLHTLLQFHKLSLAFFNFSLYLVGGRNAKPLCGGVLNVHEGMYE